jgi:23S rRNA (cytosine1962-C5)-methyltransferase
MTFISSISVCTAEKGIKGHMAKDSSFPRGVLSSRKIEGLLKSAFDRRKELYRMTNAVRLVNGLGDDLPGLVINQYHRHFSVLVYDPAWKSNFETIRNVLQKTFELDHLVFKDASAEGRQSKNAYAAYACQKESSRTVVTENGFQFLVDLEDQINAGLFLDMRRNRSIVGGLCAGKSVLNTFAYTCSFGVYARGYQAARVVNVDMNGKILEWGKKNYELNGLLFSEEEFIKSDVHEYLRRAVKIRNYFDVVILDPPSFSRFEGKVFTVRENLEELIDLAVQIVRPDGHLFVSTNYSEMTHKWLQKMIMDRADHHARKVKKMVPLGQDRDFQGSGQTKESYLTAWLTNFKETKD